jgi:hypothetical protein
VLAGGPIRADLQAHRAVARVEEQPPPSARASLLGWMEIMDGRGLSDQSNHKWQASRHEEKQ